MPGYAWTPDEEIERGVEEFKKNFPEAWERWLEFCRSEDGNVSQDSDAF